MPDSKLMIDLYNTHLHETCIVIGNGPGLSDIPIKFLQYYPSFGTNRIYLLKDFTPMYYVVVNQLVIEQYYQDMIQIQCKAKFVKADYQHMIPDSIAITSMNPDPPFSFKPLDGICEGNTVTYVALQLVYWMGFERVLLVGVDHKYSYSGNPNEECVFHGDDLNHFDPSYFREAHWNNPDLEQSEGYYAIAKYVFETTGRRIINCSTRTELNVFEKADWKDYA